jgi:hypothetical protein
VLPSLRGDSVQIYELDEVLEKLIVYSFNPLKIVDIMYPEYGEFQTKETPDWVIKEVLAGNNINAVMEYLKQRYKEVYWALEPIKLGYDIIADGQYFKIKSLESDHNKFYITNKELYLAFRQGKAYNIFFIKKAENCDIGYIAENFYSILDIEHKEFIDKTNMHCNQSISMISVNYEMALDDDYIKGLDKIQLSDNLS